MKTNKKDVVYKIELKAKDIINIHEMVDSYILLGVHTQRTDLVEKGVLHMKLIENIREQCRSQLLKKDDKIKK